MLMKCSTDEWNHVVRLAVLLSEAADCDSEKSARRRYFSFLRALLKKYGDDADILASIADFYIYDRPAVSLLKKAYACALKNGDRKNLTFISASLASRLICSGNFNIQDGACWLKRLRKNLLIYPDEQARLEYRECCRVFKEKMRV